jgi:hypothetical protein
MQAVGMGKDMPPSKYDVHDQIAILLGQLSIPDQARVLAEAMSRLLARSGADDIGVALFVETICDVVPDRVRTLRNRD